jgi:ATP-dependent Lon protease
VTILRFPQDGELHDEHGEHIDPTGLDANTKARLKRHIDRHIRDGDHTEELKALRKEWDTGEQAVKDAEAFRDELRAAIVVELRRLHSTRGVKQYDIARMFDMDERSVRDYLKHGHVVKRG